MAKGRSKGKKMKLEARRRDVVEGRAGGGKEPVKREAASV